MPSDYVQKKHHAETLSQKALQLYIEKSIKIKAIFRTVAFKCWITRAQKYTFGVLGLVDASAAAAA